MKRLVLVMGAFLMLQSFVCGQTYTTEKKDLFGNSTTIVKDQYGRTIETATTSQTDIYGNTTTTVKDQYGRTTGT